mgnify:CR=1 FL=1
MSWFASPPHYELFRCFNPPIASLHGAHLHMRAALLLLLPAAVACLRVPEPAAPRSTARPSSSSQPLLSRRWAVGGLSGLLATAPLSDLRAASASVAEVAAPAIALPNALCDSCVSVVQTARQEITLVGTAHISADSALLVQRVLRQVKPGCIWPRPRHTCVLRQGCFRVGLEGGVVGWVGGWLAEGAVVACGYGQDT